MAKDRVFRDALVRILENQIKIKEHLGISKCHDDNYYDNSQIQELNDLNLFEE